MLHLIALLLAFAATDASFAFYRNAEKARTAPHFHVESHFKKATSPIDRSLENAMPSSFDMEFTVQNIKFTLDLTINRKLWSKSAKIYATDDDGNEIELEKTHRSFMGTAIVNNEQNDRIEEGRAAVTFYDDEKFHCVITTQYDMYTVDRIELYYHDADHGPLKGKNKDLGMTLARHSDFSDLSAESRKHWFSQLKKKFSSSKKRKFSPRRKLHQLIRWNGCFTNQWTYTWTMNIGIITDTAWNAVYGNSNANVRTSIEAMFQASQSNVIYTEQMGITLMLGTLFIGASTTGGTAGVAQLSGSSSINTRLDTLTSWRKTYYDANTNDPHGLWHLMTNHHAPPGTVGLAWVGVLCRNQQGTGVSNYISYGEGSWTVFAHEVGHNFGAGHTFQNGQGRTGGIMDYGDGLYQGVFQFHPYNEDEVCAQIRKSFESSSTRTSWQGLIPVDNCWFNENAPTATVTTPSPTSPTTTTTIAPGPTFNPTPAPTRPPVAPTQYDPCAEDEYFWINSQEYGDCSPSCGSNSYKYSSQLCAKLARVEGTTRYYYNADDSFCESCAVDLDRRRVACVVGQDGHPSCNNAVCGNGVVESPEVCDYGTGAGGDPCCNAVCTGYKTTSDCVTNENNQINAAFKSQSGQVHTFSAGFMSVYNTFSTHSLGSNTPISTNPVSSSFPISSFGSDISAIGYKSETEVYVFSGLRYAVVDIRNNQELPGFPKLATDSFSIPDDIVSCGSITGVITASYYMVLFCKDIYGFAPFSTYYSWNYVMQLTKFGNNYNGKAVTAVYNTPGRTDLNMITVDLASYVDPITGQLNTDSGYSGNNAAGTDDTDLLANSCYDANCLSCSSTDNRLCSQCDTEVARLVEVRCIDNNFLVYLDCDNDTSISADNTFVMGGVATTNSLTYESTGSYGTGIVFDGTTQLNMVRPDILATGQNVTEFLIGGRFKPSTLSQTGDVFIDIDNGYVHITIGRDTTTLATIINATVANKNAVFTMAELNLGDWNTMEFGYANDMFVVNINYDTLRQAFITVGDDFTDIGVSVQFDSWHFGDATNGINGVLDEMYVTDAITQDTSTLNASGDEDAFYKQTWFIVVMVVLVLIIVAIIGWFSYKKCSNKQTTTKDQRTNSYISMNNADF